MNDEDIISTLMDDGVFTEDLESFENKKNASKNNEIEKNNKSFKNKSFRYNNNKYGDKYYESASLSEVEHVVLKCLEDTKSVRIISKLTGYPEIIITKAIERLIEKGYIDEELNILKTYKPPYKIYRHKQKKKDSKLIAIDIGIALAFLLLIIAIAYYLTI